VTDDYFWLREKSNPKVTQYLEAENAYTAGMTKDLEPFSDTLYKEMLGRIKQIPLLRHTPDEEILQMRIRQFRLEDLFKGRELCSRVLIHRLQGHGSMVCQAHALSIFAAVLCRMQRQPDLLD